MAGRGESSTGCVVDGFEGSDVEFGEKGRLGAEPLELEGVGEPVRCDRWFVFPNLAAQADEGIAQRGWRIGMIR